MIKKTFAIFIVIVIIYFGLIRNIVVYVYRTNIINNCTMEEYKNLPDYEEMVFVSPFRFNWDDHLEKKQ